MSADLILAITALAVSGVALFVALFQTLIQCFVSRAAREKCLSGSIGGWSKSSSKNWDFFKFQLRVKYPAVDLDIFKVLPCRPTIIGSAPGNLRRILRSIDCLDDWEDYDRPLTWPRVLQIGTKAIHTILTRYNLDADNSERQLTMRQFFKLAWFVARHKKQMEHLYVSEEVRASWANLLDCVGVTYHADLILGQKLAETIPSAFDAPIQRSSLLNIIRWCFVLGLNKVEIQHGVLSASSKYARLETTIQSNVPGIGKVIGMHGNLRRVKRDALRSSVGALEEIVWLAEGRFNLVWFRVDYRFFNPMSVVYALQNQWNFESWGKYEDDGVKLSVMEGNLAREAAEWSKASDKQEEWTEFWSSKRVGISGCPSLLKTFAFLPYHSIYGGFPLKSLLSPYQARFNTQSRREWWTTSGNKLCKVNDLLTGHLETRELVVPFVRTENEFVVAARKAAGSNFYGWRSWMLNTHLEVIKSWTPELYEHICDPTREVPIADVVKRLLSGETSVNEVRDDWERQLASTRNASVQATLWLTLFLLDARIQSLWRQIDPNCHINECRHWLIEETRTSKIPDAAQKWRLRQEYSTIFNPSIAMGDFLALWIEICSQTDPLSNIELLQSTFDERLALWELNTSPCVPELNRDGGRDELGRSCARNVFVAWINEVAKDENGRGRKEWVRDDLLPLLQLRCFLMWDNLHCYGDSSCLLSKEFVDETVWVG